MTTTRTFPRRSAAVLAAVLTATVGTVGWALAADDVGAAPAAESCAEPRDDAPVLPAGLRDGSQLFVTKYRSVIVELDSCGAISLIEPTGWDSCYFLHEDEVIRYPC
jgi:hypothetical protein